MSDLNTIGGLHYDMMRRCYNKNSIAYKRYGANGIKVCEDWHDREVFRKWAIDNGYKKGLRVNRKDSSKDYCPDNCFLGTVNKKIKDGKAQRTKAHMRIYKAKKKEIGLKRIVESPLYRTYIGMHQRCENTKHNHYKYYGEKGIKVCEEWSGKDGIYNFIKWAIKNGWEKGLTLDRIKTNGNYEPSNCRWATWETQGNNKNRVIKYKYGDEFLSISQISRKENVQDWKIRYRLKKGMSIYEAIKDCKMKGEQHESKGLNRNLPRF